jgi:hypothetical protein
MPEHKCRNCNNYLLYEGSFGCVAPGRYSSEAVCAHPVVRSQGGTLDVDLEWNCVYFIPCSGLNRSQEKKKIYKSKDGFELVPLRRGFSLIRPLWSILEKVKSNTNKDCFICGGYARWCASPKYKPVPAGDIDIYCETTRVFNKIKAVLSSRSDGANLKVKVENNMAVTYEHPKSGEFHYMPPIQLIKPVLDGAIVARGSKKKVLSNFDFTIIRAAIETPNDVFVDADFIEDETHQRLRLKNIHNPLSSLLRCCKYTKRGYFLPFTEAIKLFNGWDSINYELKTELSSVVELIRNGEIIEGERMTAWYDIFRGRKV